MDKFDILEEKKREVMLYIENKDLLTNEQKDLIKEGFDKLSNYYKSKKCYNETIQEYMFGSLLELFEIIKSNVNSGIKENQGEKTIEFFGKMEKNLEESSINEKEIESFELENDNMNQTIKFCDILKETLIDVQNTQNRILGSRMYSKKKIEEINGEALHLISSYIKNIEEKIHAVLSKEDIQTANVVIEKCKEMLTEMKLQDEDKSQQEEFKKSLDVKDKLDYRTQNQNAIEYLSENYENTEEQVKGKGLPDDFLQ